MVSSSYMPIFIGISIRLPECPLPVKDMFHENAKDPPYLAKRRTFPPGLIFYEVRRVN